MQNQRRLRRQVVIPHLVRTGFQVGAGGDGDLILALAVDADGGTTGRRGDPRHPVGADPRIRQTRDQHLTECIPTDASRHLDAGPAARRGHGLVGALAARDDHDVGAGNGLARPGQGDDRKDEVGDQGTEDDDHRSNTTAPSAFNGTS